MKFRCRRKINEPSGVSLVSKFKKFLRIFKNETRVDIENWTIYLIIFQQIGQLACTLCDHYIMGNSIYVIILGLIGTVSRS